MVKNIQNHIEKSLTAQREASERARVAYTNTHDPNILIDFIRSSHFALHEKWVASEIDQWRINDLDLLLKALKPWRGERKEKHFQAMENLEIVIMVEEYSQQGLKREQAFKKITEREDGNGWESIRKRYYKTRNFKAEIYIDKTENYTAIKAYPTIIEQDGVKRPGQWEIMFPNEGETQLKWSVSCTKKRFRLCKHLCSLCPHMHVEDNTPIQS